ncbi:MAG: glycerol-3-phosphate cytidylyltransferase [Treponema sp. CETP13]|nr:MAG: glycerol-3-phosphate cytidylyltransferase [Treponema sp. CETP13]
MKKVITYGTYDLFHYGHLNLLEKAKELGDYLIVGVTSDSFDKTRGKINVQQSLMERIESVKATGLADKIIVEEYIGQKIDDIKRYDVDIFTVGSDWIGKFDYLNEFCKVFYLDRTKGVSSSQLRSDMRELHVGLVGRSASLLKFEKECRFVNGISVKGIYSDNLNLIPEMLNKLDMVTDSYEKLLEEVDAVYIISHPKNHYEQIKTALNKGKHVLCETPITLDDEESKELFTLAEQKKYVLMESNKTAYSTAYARLQLLIKSGIIGRVISVDARCTSLLKDEIQSDDWGSFFAWGPVALLPVFQLLGTEYDKKFIITQYDKEHNDFDLFTQINFLYESAVANIKVAKGMKSESDLVISGTDGYIYVPAPWWKTDYFEVRYENPQNNKKYFYQLDGEGIRYEIVSFLKSINTSKNFSYIDSNISVAITKIMKEFLEKKNVEEIL